MINKFKKWYSDVSFPHSISNWLKQLLFNPCRIRLELMIRSRDHIPVIAACRTGSLQNVKALYGQLMHQMLSISAFCSRKDLAGCCLEQGARLDTHDAYIIHEGIIAGKSLTTCKFLVAKVLDINYYVERMYDMLLNAVNYNYLAWVRFCIENGANLNLNLDLNIYSALAAAATVASVDVASLLFEHNAT